MTDRLHDEAVKALAEALDYSGTWDARTNAPKRPTQLALDALRENPTLARRLRLGTALDLAVAALPEGWVLKELRLHDDVSGWGAEAFNTTGVGRYRHMGYGPTPTAALLALAEKLEARK